MQNLQDYPAEDIDSNILQNYSFLKETGILSYIDSRNEEIRYLKYVIEAAKELTKKPDIFTMLDYVAKSFLDRFVPSSLVFVLEEERGGEKPQIICYEKMNKVKTFLDIKSLNPYKFFFSLSPAPVTFPVFQYMIGNSELTGPFLRANPALIVPIMGFEQAYGFIIVGKKLMGDEYTKYEIEFIKTLMNFTSIGIQNNIHYLRAITDRKTRLYNHAFVMNRLEIELDRVQRYEMQIAVIIIDVDNFKVFNDTYGHLAGDKMLLRIAEVLTGSIRKGDIAGRFGGEEFVLILANCPRLKACEAAERVRKNVEKITLVENGKNISVTISLGIRHVSRDSIKAPEEILKEADMALYQAKKKGRNRSIEIRCQKCRTVPA